MRFRCGQDSKLISGFRYYATIDDGYYFITPEMVEWCYNNFKKDRYWNGVYSFYFTNEEDRNWFILRWG